ncbi:MAG: hypothetical protein F4X53_12235 [Acidimicrobiales bacterium]|nr:hypothetical protein [Acidimicrobiales bacterium]MYB82376.1 hypothetical protein [Acidimicrobiales bacterium]
MADDDMRPRPVPPPAGSSRGERRPGKHRPMGALWADTFSVVGKRWRDLAVAAIVGSAILLVALVAGLVGVDELFDGQFWEKIDALFSGEIQTSAEIDAWMASFQLTLSPQALSLLIAALVASFLAILQAAASAQVARQELSGMDAGGNAAMSIAISRLPVLLLVNLVLFTMQAVVFGINVGLNAVAYPLGVLWDVVTLVVMAVAAPLLTILWVMAYLEPGVPSLRRWVGLLGRSKAATWGRVVLLDLVRMILAAAVFFVLMVSTVPFAYALAIVIVLVWPLTVGVVTVAQVIMYEDLASDSSGAC